MLRSTNSRPPHASRWTGWLPYPTLMQRHGDDGPVVSGRAASVLATAVRALLMLVCLAPLVYMDTIYPAVVAKALFSRVLIECAFALWLLVSLYSPEYRPRKSWIAAALLAWLSVSLLSAMVGVNPTQSLWGSAMRMTGVVDLAHWTVYAVMLASMFRDKRSWAMLLLVNVGVSVAVTALAGISYVQHLLDVETSGVSRTASTLGNGLSLGSYASISAGLTIVLMAMTRTPLWVAALAPVLMLNLGAVWISGTRTGLVAVPVILAVLAVCWAASGSRLRLWIVLGALIAALLAGGVFVSGTATSGKGSSDVMVNRLASGLSGNNRSIEGRIQAGKVAVEATLFRPALGYGPENFVVAWGEFWPQQWDHFVVFDNSHNKFLEVSATTGILGLIAYTTLWIVLITHAVKAVRERREDAGILGAAVLATLAGYLVMAMVMLDETEFLMQFALLAGYLAWIETQNEEGILRGWTLNMRLVQAGAAALVLGTGLVYCVMQYNVSILRSVQAPEIRQDLSEFVEEERRLMKHFPPLSNLRRMNMLTIVGNHPDLDDHLMVELTDDIDAGMAIDPEGWLLPAAATVLYQRASSKGLDYVAESEHYLAMVKQRAPDSPITTALIATQRARTEGQVP